MMQCSGIQLSLCHLQYIFRLQKSFQSSNYTKLPQSQPLVRKFIFICVQNHTHTLTTQQNKHGIYRIKEKQISARLGSDEFHNAFFLVVVVMPFVFRLVENRFLLDVHAYFHRFWRLWIPPSSSSSFSHCSMSNNFFMQAAASLIPPKNFVACYIPDN